MMLRGAVHLNNEDYIYTAKNKFPLFFGRNHPQMREKLRRLCLVFALFEIYFKLQASCFKPYIKEGNYQSRDTVITEVNKEAKSDLVGVPFITLI